MRISRQAAYAYALRRCNYHVALALRAVPVTFGIVVILATPRNARITTWYLIKGIAGAVAWPCSPAIATPVGTTGPVLARALLTRQVLIIALTRRLGLP